MERVNSLIKTQYCSKTSALLTDKSLIDSYQKCNSVKKKIEHFKETLKMSGVDNEKIEKALELYMPSLVPPGAKGAIRGNLFNDLVKQKILSLKLGDEYVTEFEKKTDVFQTDEIPDWTITKNNKVLVGMNQMDLWSGGQQINRGSKYILQNKESDNGKIVSVVCSFIQCKKENKAFKILEKGFRNSTLCYLNGLEKIIKDYFEKEDDGGDS